MFDLTSDNVGWNAAISALEPFCFDHVFFEVLQIYYKSTFLAAQIFAGAFPGLYVPPSDNFYFETDDPAPLVQVSPQSMT